MKVVILAGGLGTRLREETEFRPKPMVMVGGKPILWHIMKIYAHYGYDDFIICLGYKGEMIKQYFMNYQMLSNDFTMHLNENGNLVYHTLHGESTFKITFVETGLHTMTGGRIKRIADYVGDEPFMVTYGDGLSNVDIPALVAFHQQEDNIATVTATRPVSRFGIIKLSDEDYAVSFLEKPQMEFWTSAGFMMFDKRVFSYIEGDDTVLESTVMHQLANEGALRVFRHDGFFFAMDTYREYLQLNKLWDNDEAPWKIWD